MDKLKEAFGEKPSKAPYPIHRERELWEIAYPIVLQKTEDSEYAFECVEVMMERIKEDLSEQIMNLPGICGFGIGAQEDNNRALTIGVYYLRGQVETLQKATALFHERVPSIIVVGDEWSGYMQFH